LLFLGTLRFVCVPVPVLDFEDEEEDEDERQIEPTSFEPMGRSMRITL
jgi:hypothetical protein